MGPRLKYRVLRVERTVRPQTRIRDLKLGQLCKTFVQVYTCGTCCGPPALEQQFIETSAVLEEKRCAASPKRVRPQTQLCEIESLYRLIEKFSPRMWLGSQKGIRSISTFPTIQGGEYRCIMDGDAFTGPLPGSGLRKPQGYDCWTFGACDVIHWRSGLKVHPCATARKRPSAN